MSILFNPILLTISIAGILLILLTIVISFVVELNGRRKEKKLRKLLEDERIMSDIAIEETENKIITSYDDFLLLVNSIVPEQEDKKNRILEHLEEIGSHNHVEEAICCANPDDPAKWWQIRYFITRDEKDVRAGAILINIDEKKKFDAEIKKLENKISKRILDNKMYITMSQLMYIPLNAIANACNKIVLAGKDIDEDFRNAQMDIANENLQNINKTIEDFRNCIKIETGALNLKPEIISVKDFIESAFEEYKPIAEKDGSTFFLVYGREDATINVDKRYLQLIITELIDNAKKFTDHGNIAIGWKTRFTPASVEIFIEDSGLGITKEDKDKIFDVGWTKSIYYYGNGIGLTLAKTFAEVMGGTLKCESQVGIGSRFYLTFNTVD